MAHIHDTGKRNGQAGPKPGLPRSSAAAVSAKDAEQLPSVASTAAPASSPVAEHAKAIMLELIRHRANYLPEAVAAESFKLARAFAAEAAKDVAAAKTETSTAKLGESSDG